MYNVAKTYQSWEQIGEVIVENKKTYINVRKPGTNTLKKVRTYSDKEFAKMYKDTVATIEFPARHAFGFDDDGFITIYTGSKEIQDAFFEEHVLEAWYATFLGWYTPSKVPVRNDLPKEMRPITIKWEDVSIDDTHLKDYTEIKKIVDKARKAVQ